MPRRKRPQTTTRSEHWLRVAVNPRQPEFDRAIGIKFGWPSGEKIKWSSPIHADDYAEYYDDAFLKRLELDNLSVPLKTFWPASGPRWDGLARTESNKVLLVEAKAYIEEAVDYGSRAGTDSGKHITQ